jgi:hypothetical protein
MTEHDGFRWTEDSDGELNAVERLWIAMGWLGEAIFQYEELMRAAELWCRAQVRGES